MERYPWNYIGVGALLLTLAGFAYIAAQVVPAAWLAVLALGFIGGVLTLIGIIGQGVALGLQQQQEYEPERVA